jgi:hypothetical protein
MIVQRVSILDNKIYEMDLPIKPDDLVAYLDGKGHVQDLFPYLSADQREFIMSGITPEEWNKAFGKLEE